MSRSSTIALRQAVASDKGAFLVVKTRKRATSAGQSLPTASGSRDAAAEMSRALMQNLRLPNLMEVGGDMNQPENSGR